MKRELTKGRFPIEKFSGVTTPFYYYDTTLLRNTLRTINEECKSYDNFNVHYAVKANANPKVLNIISQAGLGADCVSGGEIQASLKSGFPANKIVFAGVGKSDWEINLALDADIFHGGPRLPAHQPKRRGTHTRQHHDGTG